MTLPFTLEQFLDVFRAYNLAIWPAQLVLYALGAALVLAAVRAPDEWGRRVVPAGLALLWAWTGGVYQLAFFTAINPAARVFGGAFLAQALVWLLWAWRTPTLRFHPTGGTRRLIGAAILAYALILYPLLNVLLDHPYPTMPTFGAPCPTTIATFGLLAWAAPRPPWIVWLIPVSWALVGTSAAFALGVREDLGLPAAAILAILVQLGSRSESARA